MAITKIYKGSQELENVVGIYKGSELVYEKEEPGDPTIAVVFKSDSPRTITPKFTQSNGVTLQYSIDKGSTWNNISSGATTASSDEIWFRGRATGTKSLSTASTYTSNAWVFSGDASNKLHVYGDLRYLLCDNLGDKTITFNIGWYCFAYMFRNCTALVTAPSLPATTLPRYCYYHMFEGCTSLTTAPSLPATTIPSDSFSCYGSMFRNCTSLTTAPSLPATTVPDGGYSYMFYGCTSLTTPPSLPATTLRPYCYSYMFYGCIRLARVTRLPATTISNNSYEYMFYGCTSLRITTSYSGSYPYSWRIPTSGTGTAYTGWNTNMLYNTGGTFKSNPELDRTYYAQYAPV